MSSKQKGGQAETVTNAFEQPEWYLNGYAANIRIRCETIASFTKGRAFGQVLDIGCGDGSLSLPFLSNSCRVTYLDLSSAMLDIVKKRVPHDLLSQASFVKGDITQIDLPPASFDAILFVGVMAYVSDVAATAKTIRQFIRPGGTLVVECTDAAHILAKVSFGYRDITSKARAAKCHTFRHRGPNVVEGFKQAGFNLLRTFRYSYSLPIASKLISQKQSYAATRRLYGTADVARHQGSGSEMLMLFEAAS
jgi:ubiquinone/menaquinone biosynthesis C-methylase UbiE